MCSLYEASVIEGEKGGALVDSPDTYLCVDSQGFLQGVPVLAHPQWEISVVLVHCGHPFPYLCGMDVALFHKAVR